MLPTDFNMTRRGENRQCVCAWLYFEPDATENFFYPQSADLKEARSARQQYLTGGLISTIFCHNPIPNDNPESSSVFWTFYRYLFFFLVPFRRQSSYGFDFQVFVHFRFKTFISIAHIQLSFSSNFFKQICIFVFRAF